MPNTLLKKPNSLFGFFYRHWITLVLLVVIVTLVNQSFFINHFPTSIENEKNRLHDKQQQNAQITEHNQQLEAGLAKLGQTNMELVESTARYKFGLIKDGELFYRISTKALSQDQTPAH